VPNAIGIEKHGDSLRFSSVWKGEPLHQIGAPMNLHIDGPFYVGIGFCSHLPDKVGHRRALPTLILENSAGKVR